MGSQKPQFYEGQTIQWPKEGQTIQWPKDKRQKDKQRSTKHHPENQRLSNTNYIKNRG